MGATGTTPSGKPSRAEYYRNYRAAKKKERLQSEYQTLQMIVDDPAEVVANWSLETLKVPSGPLMGQPFRIDPWQVDFLRDALAPGVQESGLSVARKNGKSGLIAALVLAYLVGPLNRPEWRGLVVSLTGNLAGELRDAISSTAAISGLLVSTKRSPPPGEITGINNSRLTILASDKASGHAVGADLAIIDESGLLQETHRPLWNAVFSSVSGRNGKLICISIKGDGPMFHELSERANHPGVVWHQYMAAEDCELDDPIAWAAANPGLASGIKSTDYMVGASRRALASPPDQPSFKAFDLNLPRNPSTETLASVEDWRRCERGPDDLPPRQGPCVVGFDLGGSSSLTALSVCWPETGRMETFVGVGDNPSLGERSVGDGVGDLYQRMADRGELTTYSGRVTPAEGFLADCAARLSGERVVVAGADRYRQQEAMDAMGKAGVRWPMRWRGQGASASADGSHDVRALQRMILSQRLAVPESLAFRHAVRESVIRRDVSGNPALDKRRQRGRIDVMSASIIAAGLAEIEGAKNRTRGRVEMLPPI